MKKYQKGRDPLNHLNYHLTVPNWLKKRLCTHWNISLVHEYSLHNASVQILLGHDFTNKRLLHHYCVDFPWRARMAYLTGLHLFPPASWQGILLTSLLDPPPKRLSKSLTSGSVASHVVYMRSAALHLRFVWSPVPESFVYFRSLRHETGGGRWVPIR